MGLIDKYSGFSFQGVSIPHLQDFLAVYELKEKKIIKKVWNEDGYERWSNEYGDAR
jgi:hypothetical protein